jgi:hypothetical protein
LVLVLFASTVGGVAELLLCLFGLLVVCATGCFSLASGLHFVFVRVVRVQRLGGYRLLAFYAVVWFHKPERVWFF